MFETIHSIVRSPMANLLLLVLCLSRKLLIEKLICLDRVHYLLVGCADVCPEVLSFYLLVGSFLSCTGLMSWRFEMIWKYLFTCCQ